MPSRPSENDDVEEALFPSSEDSLFDGSGSDWWNVACLGWAKDDWLTYASGYIEAADVLVAHIEDGARGQDLLVFPALFLYRQYLELTIKRLIAMSRRLLDLPGGFPRGHDIRCLWDECHTLLARACPGESTNELQEAKRLIHQFAEVDPRSDAFRYPVDGSGKASLPDLSRVNLRNTREVMGRIAALLDAAGDQLDEFLDTKSEMESEYSSEWSRQEP